MAFIVKKTVSGKEYYYLNENKRVDGKVKTKTLAYLGKEKSEAEKKAAEIISQIEKGIFKSEQLKKDESTTTKMEQKTQPDSMKTEKEKIEPDETKQVPQEILVGTRKKIDEITRIASSRGIFFQTANLYGGKAGFFTYGHLGKQLKMNWENLWRKNIVGLGDNFYEIQSNNILPEPVFKASGHVDNFNDPMTECKKCHFRFRADQFLEEKGVENAGALGVKEIDEEIKKRNLKCSKCGSSEFSETKQFNMMFSVNVGFENEKAYLSPETAQGAYVSFNEEFKATREKLPLGLAIIDKAYRNEISPRQMFFRLREFSQAELQIFFDPDAINEHEDWNSVKNEKVLLKLASEKEIKEISCQEANEKLKIPKFYLYHLCKVQNFYLNVLGIPKSKFRFRELDEKERAFYNKIHFDVEVYLETLGGFKEVAGVHYRGDHDLVGHQNISKKNLEVSFNNKKILPHVLELSFGVDRNVWALLDVFYSMKEDGSTFKFPAVVAPIKLAVLPLVKNDDKLTDFARKIYLELKEDWNVIYDATGSIGRRYARNDEIGTPFCITIDDESLKNNDVTIRIRDTTEQIRIPVDELREAIKFSLKGKNISEFGEKINTRKK